MNDARMTIRLPKETLAFAQWYADRTHSTLTDLVKGFLDRLKKSVRAAENGGDDICAEVADILPRGLDVDSARDAYLKEKYPCA